MNNTFKAITLIFITVFLFSFTTVTKGEKRELIQLAILLDTSSSMNGLINQAKSQLWKIVNELALAKKNNQNPKLEVALYEYGKSTIPSEEGYIRMIAPLTTDLDLISEELFKLTTNGGDEYCGMVIKAASNGLKWSKSNKDLKVIFIAGNEPFTQGKVDYKKSVKNAISSGIIVNTIFCGNHQEGVKTKWKHGADLADGKYINIDHNQKVIAIKAPQDKEIVRLGKKLNKTYIGYGRKGKKNKMRQEAQDMNASSMGGGSSVNRSISKASKHYSNSGWDIVDAVEEDEGKLDDLKDDDLPDEMKGMNKKERKKYVAKMAKKRKAIQKKISKLNKDRRKYVDKEMKKSAEESTLDQAIIKTIRKQAKKKNFKFK